MKKKTTKTYLAYKKAYPMSFLDGNIILSSHGKNLVIKYIERAQDIKKKNMEETK